MSMWITKAVNLEPATVILPKDNPCFLGVISLGEESVLELNKEYQLSLTIDLSNPSYVPSENFLKGIKFEPCLFTKNGADILLDPTSLTIKKETHDTAVFISLEFKLELDTMYIETCGDSDIYNNLINRIDLNLLGLTISSSYEFAAFSEYLTYEVDYLAMKASEDSSSEQSFTFEPGIVVGEDLPFTLKDILSDPSDLEDRTVVDAKEEQEQFNFLKELTEAKAAIAEVKNAINNARGETDMATSYSSVEKFAFEKESPYAQMQLEAAPIAFDSTESVNHPSHYNDSEIETFEMFILMNANRRERIIGALTFNIFKYRDRAKLKGNQPQDVEKMLWYLEKMDLLFPEETQLYQIYHVAKTD